MRSAPQVSGQVPRVVEVLAGVVYDSSSGSIAHVHRHVRFEGAPSIDGQGLEAEALEMAARHHERAGLKVLHVSGDALELEPDVEYSVDPAGQRLIQRRQLPIVARPPARIRLPRWLSLLLAAFAGAVTALVLFQVLT